MFEKSSINQAVNSVYKSLQSRLIKTYNITRDSRLIKGMRKHILNIYYSIDKYKLWLRAITFYNEVLKNGSTNIRGL